MDDSDDSILILSEAIAYLFIQADAVNTAAQILRSLYHDVCVCGWVIGCVC